ncbi:MAG: hypothetical protein SPJ13_07535 [Bacteroidales bacterium]|nr:hypothetical protein [Bacteroidales bacterium]
MDMGNDEMELLIFRYKEGLLTPHERKECEAFLAEHPEARQLADLYDPTLRVEKEQVVFPNKGSLKRHTLQPMSTPVAWRYVAACLALVVLGTAYFAMRGDGGAIEGGAPNHVAQVDMHDLRTMPKTAPAVGNKNMGEQSKPKSGTKEHTHLYKESTRRSEAILAPTPRVEIVAQVEPNMAPAETTALKETMPVLENSVEGGGNLVAYVDGADGSEWDFDMEWQTEKMTVQANAPENAPSLAQRILHPFRQYGKEKYEQGVNGIKMAKNGIGEMLMVAEDATSKLWNTAVASVERNRK